MQKKHAREVTVALYLGLIVLEIAKKGHCDLTDEEFEKKSGYSDSSLKFALRVLKSEKIIIVNVDNKKDDPDRWSKRTILLTSKFKKQLLASCEKA